MCFALQLCIYSNLLSAVGKFSLDLKESRPVFKRGAARGADAREGRCRAASLLVSQAGGG